MARDIKKYISQLENRRADLTRIAADARHDSVASMAKSWTPEGWRKRAEAAPFTQYTLGAMQEVDPTYTRISVDTADKVANQLRSGLLASGIPCDFRLQGSVPLNVHIRGVSDVDLLSLDTSFFTYATSGARSKAGLYTNPTTKNSLDVLLVLRREAEKILKDKYPAATVDTSGGKAIHLSGGSLARQVDVVPSHWHDGPGYQHSGSEDDRSVKILNKKVPETVENLPFLHIKLIGERCDLVGGGLRKAIRLCKNVKAEAESDGKKISLPSFDIAATMYHANMMALRTGTVNELAILAETQRHLGFLVQNHAYAKTLVVPDGSRMIFDTAEKLTGLTALSVELDELVQEVATEHTSILTRSLPRSLNDSRQLVASTYVP